MLHRLTIQNYALIEQLEIVFSDQLNGITGETGAGKSIIMGALGLVLGERADSTVLVNKEKKCVVEGIFQDNGKTGLSQFLQENDLDITEELVIRREIGANGKSRAFINDTPVNLQQLQAISSLLVDLHQQMDSWEIGENDFQLDVLDALANQLNNVKEYRSDFNNWQNAKKEWVALQELKAQLDKESDYNSFQFKELQDARFKDNELESIETELELLSHAEMIKGVLDKTNYELLEGEKPVVQQLKILFNQLDHVAQYHPELPTLIARLQSAQIELQDINAEINHISNHIQDDPRRIEQLNERLSVGYKLLKKHNLKTTNELLSLQEELKQKLTNLQDLDESLKKKEEQAAKLFTVAVNRAALLTKGREKQIKGLEEKVNQLLLKVGMPNARLKVQITPVDLNRNGADAVEFLFNANLPAGKEGNNAQFQPVRKVASGGELNRLMLCIKSLVAESIDLPTMIFDEIDTGISGEAARQVSIILKELARKRQVICITHQPQIAGKAETHFLVYKTIDNDKVKTNIRRLNPDERITVIAKMLSGEKPTSAAMENAREMMN